MMNHSTLHFRPATETDPVAVRGLLRDTCYQGCDLNIMNLAGWSFHFGTELSLDAGRLVGRFRLAGRTAYMAAVTDGSWRETLDLIAADADRLGAPLLLTGVCRHVVPHIEAAHPGRFRFTPVRNLFDYVYRREDLATLAGKKLQPKRNHANRFARLYPGYVFAPMTAADAPDCLALAEQWAARHGVTLADFAYYGDSVNDVQILEAVGFPNTVNPSGELRRIAEERNWPILNWSGE